MGALPDRSTLSVEDYLQLDRKSDEARYEYLDGNLRLWAGGTLDHASIAANIIGVLYSLVDDHSCRVFTSDARVRLAEKRFVYPDVSVSCQEHDRGQTDTIESPLLIVEVLSESTEAYDRGRKFAYYRECLTIQEYVLVDTQRQAVEVFRRETDHLWTYHAFGPGEEVELASLGVRFPLANVYRNIRFSENDPPSA
jgi:Uma2 family endonuclease